ncbi:MAG: hypothetical protein H0X66_15395 [Verrucomicrobia bacterium]|nr:hypothetical protein [Verrucomicrobiota bacterium]
MKLVEQFFPVCDYDLAATLASGQAFRWKEIDGSWEGVIGENWVRLKQEVDGILAQTVCLKAGQASCLSCFDWLRDYLQIDADLSVILRSFPLDDVPLQTAVTSCRGLRLLRQDPWECLASFILSSTKQIVQIQQIVSLLCERFGKPLAVPENHPPVFSFPSAERLATCTEQELRDCKMGFRAPNLLATAKMVSNGEIHLQSLYALPLEKARAELVALPGVGKKIADCVLLFAYGFPQAFPIDVWILKALRQLYFPKRKPTAKRLLHFSQTHFGPNAGYAQQYLFHYMRTKI